MQECPKSLIQIKMDTYTSRAWSNGVGSLLSNDPTFNVAVAMPMNACSGDSQMVVGKGEMNADGGEL